MALKQLQDLLDLLFIKEIEVLLLAAEQIDLQDQGVQLKLLLEQEVHLDQKLILQQEETIIVITETPDQGQADHLQDRQVDLRLNLILLQEVIDLLQNLEEDHQVENLLQVAVAQKEAEKDNLK